eukprot:XP_022273692.1 leucine-rich repeat, immunoglobulin-like domain and transmembrane domain-containing protein 1 [Canis lupus familiaris]
MRVAVGMLWLLALWGHPHAQGSCPSQCSCSLHVLGDGSKARYGTRGVGWVAHACPCWAGSGRLDTGGGTSIFRALGTQRGKERTWRPVPLTLSSGHAEPSLRGMRSWARVDVEIRGSPPASLLLPAGLQDNPWACDCRLYDLALFLESWAPNLAFIEARLKCASPQSLAGVAFSQLELRKCQSPELRPGVASVRSPLGSAVLLRCGATGVPGPEMSWRRANGHPLNGTVHQEVSGDGASWTLLGLPAVSPRDSGDYICQAKNFLGVSETVISLAITEPPASTERGGLPEAAAYNRVVARHVPDGPAPGGPATAPPGPDAEEDLSLQQVQVGAPGHPGARMLRSLKVVGDTYQSATLVWKAPQAGNTTAFSVLYAVFGQRDMRRVAVQPGKTRVTIHGLVPKTKYVACVCMRELVPQKEQCVIFSTDEVVDTEATQRLINVVVISVAVVIALPLTLLVCCGAARRRCRRCPPGVPAEAGGAYVNLDRLGHSDDGSEELSQHSLSEAAGLLSARPSLDSQVAGARGGRRINEYLC